MSEDRRFLTTRWSMVLAAGRRGGSSSHDALSLLCESYWYPLYAYVRRRGYDPEEALDLTQGFFARLLEKRDLEAADPDRGRFRSFLITALKSFLVNEWKRENAAKRGGGKKPLSIDVEDAEGRFKLEPADEASPESGFERQWALALLARTLDGLRAEYAHEGKQVLFEALKPALQGAPLTGSLAELALELEMTEGALKAASHRARRRFRDRLRAEIAHTVATEEEVDDEIAALFVALGN